MPKNTQVALCGKKSDNPTLKVTQFVTQYPVSHFLFVTCRETTDHTNNRQICQLGATQEIRNHGAQHGLLAGDKQDAPHHAWVNGNFQAHFQPTSASVREHSP